MKASPLFASTLLEANLNRDVLFGFMKGYEMYFLVIAIMTNWPRHLIKDFWEFFANLIITGKTPNARCLQISAHEEYLKRNLHVVTLDIIIVLCCSCSGEIFFWWSVKQRNASESTALMMLTMLTCRLSCGQGQLLTLTRILPLLLTRITSLIRTNV